MSDLKNNEAFQNALAHVIQHAEFNENTVSLVDYITNNKGDVPFCIGMLGSYAEANAMVSWFRDKDLIAFKQWCFIAAKLNRMMFQFDTIEWFPAYKHLYALLSDNEEIISWYSQHRVSYDRQGSMKDRDNPRKPDFHGYQLILALNHEWDKLSERCELILQTDLKKDKKYLIDHRFYLALVNGDKSEMENVLNELTSPKIAKVRNFEFAFTFTEHFIATHAVIYTKLAWRNGYQLNIDTPWIPKEWLPVEPLLEYPEPWEFMREFDIFTPFDDEWKAWSPKRKNT
ncbi:Imm49 family immunity protein [Acinetobacter pittii]|uniref:Imm49 family immunity protein n=1 Tax=Acinetobacter pittii TaxID=48296 RepID=UPI0024DE884B|nr:Imm49 family immunity protein [Acinetobacter pittii]MDO7536800.1 Imm49 family immunity protein [Acinetobacter pittii]WVH54968.1 Imm49 family immunity protein [Acinetobacter pittii]